MHKRKAFQVQFSRSQLQEICTRHGVSRLALFGSLLTDRFRPSSDIDLVVEFKKGRTPGYFTFTELQSELQILFGERTVDLRTPAELSRYFRDDVLANSETLYAG